MESLRCWILLSYVFLVPQVGAVNRGHCLEAVKGCFGRFISHREAEHNSGSRALHDGEHRAARPNERTVGKKLHARKGGMG